MAALGSVAVFGLARELGAGDLLAAAIGFALFSLPDADVAGHVELR